MAGLGAAMAGGNGNRQEGDFYPTPPECTLALLEVERADIRVHGKGRVWEPACGDGAMAAVLADDGFEVIKSDVTDRGASARLLDFMVATQALAPAIVTNPPYGDDMPERFVRHARALGVSYVAFLLRANYWNVDCRRGLWAQWRPSAIYPLTWRVDFLDMGRPLMDVGWVVWTWPAPMTTVFEPLSRPAPQPTPGLFDRAGAP